MTRLNHKNELDRQVTYYVRFLKKATRNQAIKLSKEITRLSKEIAEIEKMSYREQKEEFYYFLDEIPSKLNSETIETTTDMSKRKRNSPENCKPIFGEAAELRRKALELASQHVDVKPVKYLLKN